MIIASFFMMIMGSALVSLACCGFKECACSYRPKKSLTTLDVNYEWNTFGQCVRSKHWESTIPKES